MKYIIEWSENKETSTGKKKLNATLKDESGVTTHGVSIWQDFPGFDGLMTGHTVEGDLVPAKDPKYGPTLYPIKPVNSQIRRSPTAINKAMEKKDESITRHQDNKEHSIKMASTISMAVNTAIAFLSGESIKDIGVFKEQVKKWREFYWLEWDKEDKDFSAF